MRVLRVGWTIFPALDQHETESKTTAEGSREGGRERGREGEGGRKGEKQVSLISAVS